MCKKPLIVEVDDPHDWTSVAVLAPLASASSIYISVADAYVPLLNAISPAPGSASDVPVSNL